MRNSQSFRYLIAAGIGIGLGGATLHAADGTWTNTAGGAQTYNNGANWLGGTVPNGIGDAANFTADITAATSVNIADFDFPNFTLGEIVIGDPDSSHNYVLHNGQIKMNNGLADPLITINNLSAGAAVLAGDVPLIVGGTGNLRLTNNDTIGFTATVGGAISASGDVIKSGPSGVLLTGTGTWSGNTYVTQGAFLTNKDLLALPATTNVILSAGASYQALDVSVMHGVHGNGFIRNGGSSITIGTYTGFVPETIILSSGGELRPGDLNPAAPGGVGTLSLSQSSIPFNHFRIDGGSDTYLDFASLASYDQIQVFRAVGADSAVFGGNLHLNFLGGFSPARGDTFDIFVGFTGTQFIDPNGFDLFDSITSNILGGDYTASIVQGGSDTIRLTVLPEPSVAGVVMCGGMLLVARRRRREMR